MVTEVKAGPDLDFQVAEKVMGWKFNNPEDAAELYRNKNGLLCHDGDGWSPSVRISQAWMVVEKMREIGWHPSIDDAETLKDWTCSLAAMDGRFVHRNASTAPEAICLAALAALAPVGE